MKDIYADLLEICEDEISLFLYVYLTFWPLVNGLATAAKRTYQPIRVDRAMPPPPAAELLDRAVALPTAAEP